MRRVHVDKKFLFVSFSQAFFFFLSLSCLVSLSGGFFYFIFIE